MCPRQKKQQVQGLQAGTTRSGDSKRQRAVAGNAPRKRGARCERSRRSQGLWLFLWVSGSHGKFGTEKRRDLTGSNRIPQTDL